MWGSCHKINKGGSVIFSKEVAEMKNGGKMALLWPENESFNCEHCNWCQIRNMSQNAKKNKVLSILGRDQGSLAPVPLDLPQIHYLQHSF